MLLQHPIIQLGCPRGRVHQTLTQVFWLRRCLVPVTHDVMMRLFFGDLIVGSRLIFMRINNPEAQHCVRDGCDSIETLEHCFLKCPRLAQIDIARGWREDHEILLILWKIHTAIVFHATWRLRNDIYFGETQAVAPSIPNMQASFRSHYHFLFRHSSDWNIDGEALNRVLTRLGYEPEHTEFLPNLPRQRI
ncbi:hypothetical protein P3T76_006313 [Phytophthora citrophthora]|uniref:Uncharacterized protein n=1 Tax=Phytophthora citrophthora TaxID=4793 RepID=A0AAD9LN19_9STRA|nr:hypothetical protein P3T76_006313 [Phytophthora citrophthora]